jgi:hypothetical protein
VLSNKVRFADHLLCAAHNCLLTLHLAQAVVVAWLEGTTPSGGKKQQQATNELIKKQTNCWLEPAPIHWLLVFYFIDFHLYLLPTLALLVLFRCIICIYAMCFQPLFFGEVMLAIFAHYSCYLYTKFFGPFKKSHFVLVLNLRLACANNKVTADQASLCSSQAKECFGPLAPRNEEDTTI